MYILKYIYLNAYTLVGLHMTFSNIFNLVYPSLTPSSVLPLNKEKKIYQYFP